MRLLSLLPLVLSLSSVLVACGGGAEGSGGSNNGGDGGNGGQGTTGGSNGGAGGGTITGSTSSTTTNTLPPGEPIVTPKEQWTWVPFDNAFCANGSTTGIGANITDKSDKVVIYLMGGGACWSELTCYALQTAVNIDTGYGEAQFDSDSKGLNGSLFNRDDPNNPLKDASYFFVPYCTGDVHGGDNPAAMYGDKPTMHVGFKNMTAYLSRIVATFPNVERVLLSGSSAGGFGAALNWWQTQAAFGEARVDLIDDSGPPLPPPYLSESLEGQWRAAWNLNATLPAECAECQSELSATLPFYATNLPKNRAALLSYTKDKVIASYFTITETKVAEGLGVLAQDLDPFDNFRYFYVDGNSHVLLGDPAGISQNGVVLQTWITQMLSDDPAWVSVKP